MTKLYSAIVALSLISPAVLAGGKPAPAPAPAATNSAAAAGALSGSHSGAVAGGGTGTGVSLATAASGDSLSSAVAGDASARAMAGDSHATSGSEATTGDNVTRVDASTTYARQVPMMIMGTLIPNECGVGAQGGGASTKGAGFLGVTWTTDRCYTLKTANAWAAMGEYTMACEMLADVSRRALRRRGIRRLDCGHIGAQLKLQHATPVPVVAPEPPVLAPIASGVTQEEMRGYVDEVFRRAMSK